MEVNDKLHATAALTMIMPQYSLNTRLGRPQSLPGCLR